MILFGVFLGLLQPSSKLVTKAYEGKYAVCMVNVYNLEWAKTILQTAQACKSPIILGFSIEAANHIGGLKVAKALVESLVESLAITVPVSLHLDHGTHEAALAAIECGFPSVMFDGSSLLVEENAALSSQLSDLCAKKGISLELEVGGIGGKEDGVSSKVRKASVEDCVTIAQARPDMLAVGIGNIHGSYHKDWPGLDFALLELVAQRLKGLPLVLHGGSYIPDDMVKRAIALGTAKVNLSSELRDHFAMAVVQYANEGKAVGKGADPRKLLAPGVKAMGEILAKKLALIGSAGRA